VLLPSQQQARARDDEEEHEQKRTGEAVHLAERTEDLGLLLSTWIHAKLRGDATSSTGNRSHRIPASAPAVRLGVQFHQINALDESKEGVLEKERLSEGPQLSENFGSCSRSRSRQRRLSRISAIRFMSR